MAEKREDPRTRKRMMIRFGKQGPEKTGFTKNLSLTGVNVNTNYVFEPGTTLQIELRFPDRKISLWGKVMWAKKVPASLAHVIECGMGIRFENPPDEWPDFFAAWEKGEG